MSGTAVSHTSVYSIVFIWMLGGGGSACDPRAHADHRPQPGEEAGGVRAGAEPTQAISFLLVSKACNAACALLLQKMHMRAQHLYHYSCHRIVLV